MLIGSIGRASLRWTLDSLARQERQAGDQVIVSFDAYEQEPHDLLERISLVESYGEGFLACAFNSGYHWYGVEQINYALRMLPITGTHVFTLGDDDIFVKDAWKRLRPLCAKDMRQPILYRFLSPPDMGPWSRLILWDEPRMKRSYISGCCIAAPREYVGPMPTQRYVEHDFDWMMEILQRAEPKQPLWLNELLVIARPDPQEHADA